MIPTHNVDDLLALACAAGDEIMRIYGRTDVVLQKSDRTPLTEADLASHRCIVSGLSKLTPDLPILSEESVSIDENERLQWNDYWLVDPLDGTKEFLNRNGEFTVNIARISNHQAIFGVVYVPAHRMLYWGGEGYGAYRQHESDEVVSLEVQSPAPERVRVLGSRSHPSPDLEAYLSQLGAYDFQAAGSSLKFCRIAEGEADVYPRFGPTSEWDTAAGHAILVASKGDVVDLAGHQLRYNSKPSLLNPCFIATGDPSRNWLF